MKKILIGVFYLNISLLIVLCLISLSFKGKFLTYLRIFDGLLLENN